MKSNFSVFTSHSHNRAWFEYLLKTIDIVVGSLTICLVDRVVLKTSEIVFLQICEQRGIIFEVGSIEIGGRI